jgi:PAS domain S-box-containing protein
MLIDDDTEEIVGTMTEINEQQAGGVENRVSEKPLRRVLDSLFTFVGVLTPDGTLVEANKAPLEAAGLQPADVLGKPFWDAYWWNYSPDVQEQLRRAVQLASLGHTSRYDVDVRIASDSLLSIDFMLAPLRDDDGQIRWLVPSAVDISERKKAEHLLRKQNERLRLLWETVGILLATDNAEAMLKGLFEKITNHMEIDTCFNFMVNEKGDALELRFSAGVPADAVASLVRLEFGQSICGTVAALRQPIVASFIQRSQNPMVEVEKALGIRAYACNPLMARGQLLGTLAFASRARDSFDEDELEFIETITKDVTLALDRLRLLNQHRERDRRKDEFLAMLAHELRNPLAPIRSAVDYLALKGLDDPDLAWSHGVIDRQVNNLVHLIDDLLEISRLTRGMIKLRKQYLSLTLLLRHAVDVVRPLLAEKQHRLDLNLGPEPLSVFGDPTRMEQVFVNLLTNAAKYTDEGGTILLESLADGDHAIVRVQDNGIGIPAEMFAKIFEPFTQLDRSLARSSGGLGIGLTLVKSLTEMHGGSITVRSAGPGSGSEFLIRLPLAQESLAHRVERGAPNAPTEIHSVRA